jgi:hypothetical protein
VASSSTPVQRHAPPVAAVNVDKRSVRQRLRDQEAKISALLHKPAAAASEGVLLKLVATLEADLKKLQAEKRDLQEALERAQQQQREDEEGLETTSVTTDEETAVVRVAQLEDELRRKTHEASLLQDRWETTLRRMVQYQVDLETHELHFTDYAAQQFQAGEEALAELKELTAKDQPSSNRQLGKKAKHMMSTLLKDLETLGERYKDSRINQEQQVADLRIAQMEWQRRAEHLEELCREHKIVLEDEQPDSVMSGPLMRFHQKMRLQQTAALQTQKELQTPILSTASPTGSVATRRLGKGSPTTPTNRLPARDSHSPTTGGIDPGTRCGTASVGCRCCCRRTNSREEEKEGMVGQSIPKLQKDSHSFSSPAASPTTSLDRCDGGLATTPQ